MPRQRPQLSITLPRNFTFHYTEGEEPKTPEREIPAPVPRSPRAEGPYRIKRRSRPPVSTLLQDHHRTPLVASDVAIPSIETPTITRPSRPLFQQRVTEPSEGYLAPAAVRKFSTLPRTPEPFQRPQTKSWNSHQDIGESIIRPLSTCSILSDSSDDSQGSLTSFPAGDGSCTSPESDAPDPFRFASVKKGKAKHWAALARNTEDIQNGIATKQARPKWTPEMDRHLWTTYLVYLQDPTVTPFKMLPGVSPPLGVCHRVAREARKSWRGGRSSSRTPSSLLSPIAFCGDARFSKNLGRPGSPDTIRASGSGSATPTESTTSKPNVWPKSGSSTRRRLRFLCKRKPTIAPHYQRLLQSRSPSPLSSTTRSISRSNSRLSEVSSPLGMSQSSPFNTRDVQISLTTSTADTMQPDGPLAQLAVGNQHSSQQQGNEWFNVPPVPFASEIPIPSDVIQGSENENPIFPSTAAETPRLGSPFGHHTWGPSRSKQNLRPATSRMQSSDAAAVGPSLRSPLRMYDTMPYPGIHKRRARHQLEDELSPGGSNMQQELIETLFGSPTEGRHRRVRSRGFSLGDMNAQNTLELLFAPPELNDHPMSSDTGAESHSSGLEPRTPTNPIRRLDSPFHGVSPRPIRSTPRHTATMSLGSCDPTMFSSIGETLGQLGSGNNTTHQ
ncbi:MAG: hypothetical protein Q9164_006010 [Protoblastenia rupestris]